MKNTKIKSILSVLVISCLVQLSISTEIPPGPQKYIDNDSLLKLIKKFKKTTEEQGKDSESLLSDTLSKFRTILGNNSIHKEDLANESKNANEELHRIEEMNHKHGHQAQQNIIEHTMTLIEPASIEEPEEEVNQIQLVEAAQEEAPYHHTIAAEVEEMDEDDETLKAKELNQFYKDQRKEDEQLVATNQHESKSMLDHLQENVKTLSSMGVKQEKYNIDNILETLTHHMIKHTPRAYHHLSKIKTKMEDLAKEHGIKNEHFENIKNQVDALHSHLKIIKGEGGKQHLEALKSVAKGIVNGGQEQGDDENENKGESEKKPKVGELVSELKNKIKQSVIEGQEEGKRNLVEGKVAYKPPTIANLKEIQNIVEKKIGGMEGLKKIVEKSEILSMITNAHNDSKNGRQEIDTSSIAGKTIDLVKKYKPDQIKGKFAQLKKYSGLLNYLAPLKNKDNMKEFVHGFVSQSGSFKDSEFCNEELNQLSEGLASLEPILKPVFSIYEDENLKSNESQTGKVKGIEMLNSLVKIDHVTTKIISKDKFVQKCITNKDEFLKTLKISSFKILLYPEVFRNHDSIEFLSISFNLINITSDITDGNFGDAGASTWKTVTQLKDLEIEGVDQKKFSDIEFKSCWQLWMEYRSNWDGKGKEDQWLQKVRKGCFKE